MRLWWLSYADEKRFRGAVILRSDTFLDACRESRVLGFSPGGQVNGFPIDAEDEWRIPESDRARLLNLEEANRLAGSDLSEAEADMCVLIASHTDDKDKQ